MTSSFRHVALIGKYQASGARAQAGALDEVMEDIGAFLEAQGCEVFVEQSRDGACGEARYPALTVEEIGQRCDLGLVVGGDGTMLGIGRQLARYGVPLIGINRGRLGFITDIPLDNYQATLIPMLAGEYEEDHRSLMHAQVMRDGTSVFDALAMNDVVVNRGATSGMVELRVSVGAPFRGQPARRRNDHRLAHRLDRLRAVGRRPAAASRGTGMGDGPDRAAHACRTARSCCRTPTRS